MSDDGYRAGPATMAAHAADLEDAAERVRAARSAAAAVQLDTGAYGWLLPWLPPVISYLQDTVITGLTDGERAVRESAETVSKAAQAYTETDRVGAQALRDGWRG